MRPVTMRSRPHLGLALAWLLVAVLVVAVTAGDLSIKEEIIRDEDDNWVDPTDMFEWRPSKMRDDPLMERAEKLAAPDSIELAVRPLSTRERNACREQRKDLTGCQRRLRELRLLRHLVRVDDNGEPCANAEFVYLRRLALNLVNKVKLAKRAPQGKAVKLELYIAPKDVTKLENLAKDAGCEHSADLERALSRALSTSKASFVDKVPSSWF